MVGLNLEFFFKDQKISWLFHFLKLKIRPTVPELSAIKKWELIRQHWKNIIFLFFNLCMAISQQLRVVSTKLKKAKYREFSQLFENIFFRDGQTLALFLKIEKLRLFSGYNSKTVHFIKISLKYFLIANLILHWKMKSNFVFDYFLDFLEKSLFFQKIITWSKIFCPFWNFMKSWHLMSPKTYKKIKKKLK